MIQTNTTDSGWIIKTQDTESGNGDSLSIVTGDITDDNGYSGFLAINSGVVKHGNNTSGGVVIQSGDNIADGETADVSFLSGVSHNNVSGAVNIGAGSSNSSNPSGRIYAVSGYNEGSGPSGDFIAGTANSAGGHTGKFSCTTGDTTTEGTNSGLFEFISGTGQSQSGAFSFITGVAGEESGAFSVTTGRMSGTGSGPSGSINFETGSINVGSGETGSINFTIGESSGDQGKINFNGKTDFNNNEVLNIANITGYRTDLTFTPNNFGSVTNSTFKYQRTFNKMHCQFTFTCGTPGSTASISLPSGLSGSGPDDQILGTWAKVSGSGNITEFGSDLAGPIFLHSTTDDTKIFIANNSSSGDFFPKGVSSLFSSGDKITMTFDLEINEWN